MKPFLSTLAFLLATAPVALAEWGVDAAAGPDVFLPPAGSAGSVVEVENEASKGIILPRPNPLRPQSVVSAVFAAAKPSAQSSFADAQYLRIDLEGYNVRSSPHFDPLKKDNIAFQVGAGALFAIRKVEALEGGLSVNIVADGQDFWVLVPNSQKSKFQFCETATCFTQLGEALRLLQEQNFGPSTLAECGIVLPGQAPEPTLAADVAVPSLGTAASRIVVPTPAPERPLASLAVENVPVPPRKPAAPQSTKGAKSAKAQKAPASEIHREREPRIVNAGLMGCVTDTRHQRRPNFSTYRDAKAKKKAFIEYMKPFALEVQQNTGLPASVIIAQAALESGWGTSHLSRTGHNYFGHSCWKRGTRTYRIEIAGHTKTVTGRCDNPRPESQGGYYLTFSNPQDSLYAYASNLLTARHRHYQVLRKTVREARPGVANWRSVIDGLGAYARPNPNYRQQVRDLVRVNNLAALESKKLCH